MESFLANAENYAIVLPLIFIVAILLLGKYITNKRLEKLRGIAAEFGLQFNETPTTIRPESASRWQRISTEWELAGTYHGVSVRIFAQTVAQGKTRNTTTYVVASFKKTLAGNFNISADNSFYKFASFFLPQELKVGDESLDTKYYLLGDSADTMRAFLKRPGIEHALDELFAFSKKISVRSDGIWSQNPGHLTDAMRLREILDAVTQKVRVFEETNEA